LCLMEKAVIGKAAENSNEIIDFQLITPENV
jgi:hypothetical protein